MVTISLCMIVKNEEKVLGRCLESLKGLFEEIIIVDTGSVDRTKEIALKYGAKIYYFDGFCIKNTEKCRKNAQKSSKNEQFPINTEQ